MSFATWESVLVAILVAVAALRFARDLSGKIALIRRGGSDRPRTTGIPHRLMRVLREVVFQQRVISGRPVVGLMHAAVFGGFLFFSLETTDHFLRPFGVHLLDALLGGYVPVFKAVLSVWAVLVLIGIVGLALRRFVFVRYSPDPTSYSSGVVAALIVLLMGTFLLARIELSPGVEKINWWVHALCIIVFPGLILRSKHFHIVMAPVAVFFRTERLAEILPLDLDIEQLEQSEEEITLGLENLAALSWKQRMDFLTCVECRRCTDHCPANLAGQELDPRGFILAGRRAIGGLDDSAAVIGPVITESALGQCTSCGACESICPVGVEHLQVLTGAKRAQALATGTGMVAAEFLHEVERTGNALGAPASRRQELIEELGIPLFEPGKTDLLLWMGCVWSYNPEVKGAVAAMLRVLNAAGVDFGVLPRERCSGHHSRRQGEEMQFQTLAGENIEALREAGVRKIVAPCPHCLHTLGQEYPALDSAFAPEVVHHSQLIAGLAARGQLRLDPTRIASRVTTYHDPCFLGRYEGEYDAPRELLARSGVELREMERSGARAVCCGGGNAGFVREQEVEVRVDQIRAAQVRETGAELLVTGCPECKMMLGAATSETRDLVELVAEAIAD